MTAARGEEPVDNVVVAFRPPPIRQTTIVHTPVEHTFSVFVRRLAEWWPLVPFSLGQDRVRGVLVEERVGGQVLEQWDDGSTWSWGEILAFDEPHRFSMTWNVTGTPTVVELQFVRVTDAITRVELEHRGWERLSEAELGKDCAVPGGYHGGAFHRGWAEVLGCFARAAEAPLAEEEDR